MTGRKGSMSSKALKRSVVQPRSEGGHMFHLILLRKLYLSTWLGFISFSFGRTEPLFSSCGVTDIVQTINDRFSVPVTKAEFAVIRTACSYFLPHMIGWDIIDSQGKRMLASPPRSPSIQNPRTPL